MAIGTLKAQIYPQGYRAIVLYVVYMIYLIHVALNAREKRKKFPNRSVDISLIYLR
jgi:hypothetical protein